MPKLTPADKTQCQAEKSNGVNFMTLGGRREMVRCTNKPVVIAVEDEPGEDGERGSMSLCSECLTVFTKQMPKGFATFIDVDE